jgi:hypothetical protein
VKANHQPLTTQEFFRKISEMQLTTKSESVILNRSPGLSNANARLGTSVMPQTHVLVHILPHPRTIAVALGILFATPALAGEPKGCSPAPLLTNNVVITKPVTPIDYATSGVISLEDVTGDGIADLSYGFGNTLFYLAGRKDWWDFEPAIFHQFPTPPITGNIILTHLNGDGILDAVTDENDDPPNSVRVRLGTGALTFGASTSWGPNEPSYVWAVKDFNGDSISDILYSLEDQMSYRILWGAANVTFPTFSAVITVGPFLDGSDYADIDLDGDLDMIVDLSQSSTRIMRNNGDGTFANEVLTGPDAFNAFTFSDLNGDLFPDVVQSYYLPGAPGYVYVYINDQTGHFPTFVGYVVVDSTSHVSNNGLDPLVADFDGDARPEIAVRVEHNCSATTTNEKLVVLQNTGDGTYATPPTTYRTYTTGNQPGGQLFAKDLNGDGRLDIVFNRSQTNLLLNNGQGGFVGPEASTMGPSVTNCNVDHWHWYTYGDVNNDSRFDIVWCGSLSYPVFGVALQDAQGDFTNVTETGIGQSVSDPPCLADFDLDGDLDAAYGYYGNTIRTAQGAGNGTFSSWTIVPSLITNPLYVSVANLNGDLYPDVVAGSSNGTGVAVFLNSANGTVSFAPPVHHPTDELVDLQIADLTGDGHPDIVISVRFSGVAVMANNGDGTFAAPGPYHLHAPVGQFNMAFGDLNGDNSLDLAVSAADNPPSDPNAGGIAVALNNGDGTFQFVAHLDPTNTKVSRQRPAIVDLNNDGNNDIVIIDLRWMFNVFLGNGDGTFGPRISYPGAQARNDGSLHVADFDGDGDLDLGSPHGASPDGDDWHLFGFARLMNNTCPPCPADIDNSGGVNVDDLLAVINGWGASGGPADINQDGVVNVDDLLAVINAWGTCP